MLRRYTGEKEVYLHSFIPSARDWSTHDPAALPQEGTPGTIEKEAG